MSDQEVFVGRRKINRLNIDSEEEDRRRVEQEQREEEIRLRKEAKRKRREEQARRLEEQEQKRIAQQRHYEDPNTMIEPDSDSNDRFQRAQKKIRKFYPQLKHRKEDGHRRRYDSDSEELQSDEEDDDSEDSEDSESESESQSQSESQVVKKKKPIKKAPKKERRQRKRQQSEQQERRAIRNRAKQVKVEEKDPKEKLVGQLAVRWWYCLPEWPPAEYDYQAELRKQGYRLVQANRFRMEENIVDGLFKAAPIDGYLGFFKAKAKLVDARPKEICPTLNFFRSKTMQELTSLLKTALESQITILKKKDYQSTEDVELVAMLSRKLHQLE